MADVERLRRRCYNPPGRFFQAAAATKLSSMSRSTELSACFRIPIYCLSVKYGSEKAI
jgi:hypothetical protein